MRRVFEWQIVEEQLDSFCVFGEGYHENIWNLYDEFKKGLSAFATFDTAEKMQNCNFVKTESIPSESVVWRKKNYSHCDSGQFIFIKVPKKTAHLQSHLTMKLMLSSD